MKPWFNRLRTYLSRVLAVPDTEHLYDDGWSHAPIPHGHREHIAGCTRCEWPNDDLDPVRYYRGRSGDDEEWPVHGEDPRP